MSYHLPPLSERPAFPGRGLSQPAVIDDYNRQLMQHVGEVSARGGWGYQEVTYYRYDTGTYPVLVGDIATAATLRVERHDYATEAAIEPLSLASAVMPAQPQLDTRSRRRLRSRDGDFYSNGLSDW